MLRCATNVAVLVLPSRKDGLVRISLEGRVCQLVRLGRRICERCGYDLTGNVSGVCPECGNPVGVAYWP